MYVYMCIYLSLPLSLPLPLPLPLPPYIYMLTHEKFGNLSK